jgi:hypothetical protein
VILTSSQIKIIANRVRELPDEVLVGIGIGHVLGQQCRVIGPSFGSGHGWSMGVTPANRVAVVVEFVREHPGARMMDIMSRLGCRRGTANRAVRSAVESGAIERRGAMRDAAYYPKAERSEA